MTFDWSRSPFVTAAFVMPPSPAAYRSVLCGSAAPDGRCRTCGARIESTSGQHYRLVPISMTNGAA